MFVKKIVFATNSNFVIPIFLQADVVDQLIFETISLTLKYQRLTPSDCKDIRIIWVRTVAET